MRLIILTLALLTAYSSGAVAVIFYEDGDDVVVTWDGSLDTIELTDTTRTSPFNGHVVGSNSLHHFNIVDSLGFYGNHAGVSSDLTPLEGSDFHSSFSPLPAAFGFDGSSIHWNDVHIAAGQSVGSVTRLEFDASRDIIRFEDTTLAAMNAEGFNNTLAWTADVTGDTIRYTTITSVPEPTSFLFLFTALPCLLRRRR